MPQTSSKGGDDPTMAAKKYRNEIKLRLSEEEYRILSARIAAVLAPDSNMGEEGYRISSLYFDDLQRSALYEKLAGAPDRKKYRIRIYNGSDAFIRLECKEKNRGKICKRSVRIDRTVYEQMLRGETEALSAVDHPLARETVALMRANGLAPSVIVNYIREAYVHPLSTTRITFDRKLSVPINTLDLFAEADERLVFPQDDTILEIKYDTHLPRYIADLLQCRSVPVAASKFVLCTDYLDDRHIRILPNSIDKGEAL